MDENNNPQTQSNNPQSPSPPQGNQPHPPMSGAKSSVTAGLLGIFLGGFGVHDFYLGYKSQGIIHVCIAGGGLMLFILSGVVAFASVGASSGGGVLVGGAMSLIGMLALSANGIWGLVSGIMCLAKSGKYKTDANGIPLT